MRQASVTGTVGAPIDVVYDHLLDSRNDARWCPLVDEVELVEGTPGIGAVYRTGQRTGVGRTTLWTRTTVAERPHLLSWDNADRGLSYHATIELEPTPDGSGTVVRHTNRVTTPNTVTQLVWFVGAQVVLRRQLRALDQELSR